MSISINERLHSVSQGIDDRRENERRKSADKWIYLLRSLAVISWLLFFVALCIAYNTAPESNASLHYYMANKPDHWLLSFNNYLYEILWSSAFTSYLCIVLAKYRSRRKKDSKHFNLTMLLVAAFTWATYMLTTL
mgnify:CR=1 FL=1